MTATIDKPVVVTHIISGDLWAGAEVQVYNLCKGLIKTQTVRPTAIVFNEGLLSARLRELGVEVEIADETRLGPIGIIRAISAHCRKSDSRVVHTHGFKENILGVLAKDLARVPRSIRTVHGNPETPLASLQIHKRLIQKLDILLGRFRQDYIVAVSTQLEEFLETRFPGKVVKIFNFIDFDSLKDQWPKPAKSESEAVSIGIVGRLVPVKRVDLFLETLALLKSQEIAYRGVVIGAGPMETALKKLTASLGLQDLVEFKGFVDPVHEEIRKLDILLMPSDHEGLPMTLLEALALDIPTVAHSVGGIPDLFQYSSSAWLVTAHNPSGYSDAINKVISSIKERQHRRKPEDHSLLRDNFDIKPNISKYLELYI